MKNIISKFACSIFRKEIRCQDMPCPINMDLYTFVLILGYINQDAPIIQ